MKIVTPDYYKEFRCIAGACEDTCCAGWQVDVDDASFAYYKSIQGPFGDRLHSVMIEPTKTAEGQFRICEDGRCPFLNDQNLCDLYTELGEDALCVTCDQYPRFTTEFGNLRETGIALSCKTAAELILRDNRTPGFSEMEDPDSFPSLNSIDGTRFLHVMQARKKAYEILWDRTYTIWDRLILVLYFATDLQRKMRHPEQMDAVCARYTKDYMDGALAAAHAELPEKKELAIFYDETFFQYMHQTIIKPEWPQLVKNMYELVFELPAPWEKDAKLAWKQLKKTKAYPDIATKTTEFLAQYERTYEYENLATYFIFRYFARGILDGDVLTKVKMGVVSMLILLQCDVCEWKRSGTLSFQEQVEMTHLYSREVEHSEENFAALCKIFSKNRNFADKNLVKMLVACKGKF